jgi:hypothetical protein
MIQYVFSPRWFYGIDIIFELFSILVVVMLARYGYRLYGITKDKKHKYFSVFFLLAGIALVFKILSNFNIYYLDVSSIRIANSIFYFESSRVSEVLFTIGFTAFRFLIMMAFFGLLSINWKAKPKVFYLCTYFIAVISVFSYSTYYVFHLTMFAILFGLLNHYKNIYKTSHSSELLFTAIAFFMLLLSQVAFALIIINTAMYVAGEILQLAGFSIMLYQYILVRKYEK